MVNESFFSLGGRAGREPAQQRGRAVLGAAGASLLRPSRLLAPRRHPAARQDLERGSRRSRRQSKSATLFLPVISWSITIVETLSNSLSVTKYVFSSQSYKMSDHQWLIPLKFYSKKLYSHLKAEAGARLTCHLVLRLFKTSDAPHPACYANGVR